MQTQTGINLPVSPTQIDGSAFNNALPQGNDVWPQVQFNPGADTQTGAQAIALFRTYAQSRANKSPIHCFTYNLLQQNRFQNQLFTAWCQSVVDFCDFLMRGQNQPPQQAADKAASRVYQVLMASLYRQYPALQQFLDQSIITGLNDAALVGQAMQNDIAQFKQRLAGGYNVSQPAFNQFGVQPQVMPSHGSHLNQFAVQGVGQPVHATHNPDQSSAPAGGSGMFLGVEPLAKPTSSWSTNPTPQPTTPQPTVVTPVAQPVSSAPEFEETDMRAPTDVRELKVDPWYYQPKGFTVDPKRPYDRIRNPGGVEIRPAHQVDWKLTVGSNDPYPQLYNPQTHMRFLAKWADGVVKEVIVVLEPEMDYLKHEINEALRIKAMRPKGIVVPLPQYSQSEDTSVTDVETAKELWDLETLKAEHLSPVRLNAWMTGSSDLENEAMARKRVQEQLGLKEDDPVPPHEYVSCKLHVLDISKECYQALLQLENVDKAGEVVSLLKKLLAEGVLPLRYYNFIVKRLTQGTNDFLKDSLSMGKIRIDDFAEDVVDLIAYLRDKKGDEIAQVFEGNVESIVMRATALGEETVEEDGQVETTYALLDEYINFQLGILSDELSNLNLTDEACVVTQSAHPVLLGAIRAMCERAKQDDMAQRVKMRVISADGFYYEVVVGKLTKGALLLKRV